MAVAMLYDGLILVGSYDASADHNEVKVELNADVLEATRFGHTNHVNTIGLPNSKASGTGWLQIDDSTTPKAVDQQLWSIVGSTEQPITLSHSTSDVSIAYLGKALASGYKPDWTTAQLAKFNFELQGNKKFTRGRLMAPLASRNSDSNGTDVELGAVSSTQKLVACLHVTAFSGTSLVVTVRSAAASGMVGATDRITFATATGVTSEFKEVSGAITDTWFDVAWDVTAATATFAVSVGIR